LGVFWVGVGCVCVFGVVWGVGSKYVSPAATASDDIALLLLLAKWVCIFDLTASAGRAAANVCVCCIIGLNFKIDCISQDSS